MDDVRAIVQRAIKDLSIEQSLKTYEEVWLSKKFELCEHARNKAMVQSVASKDQEEANMVRLISFIFTPSMFDAAL